MAVETQTMPAANGHLGNGDVEMGGLKDSVVRFASGMILPPPEIKSVIDRTAAFVARSANPPQFEDKIRENQRNDPKFSFLNPMDPYHAYYRNRMEKVQRGEEDEAPAAAAEDKPAEKAEEKVVDLGEEPPQPEFILDLPNVTAIDLDIMKLTALFTARRGRNFLAALSAREGRNYQFDFLRPTHSLFGYFNRLVEQYTKVLYPTKETVDSISARAQDGAKWRMLEQAKRYAKWEQNKREKEKKREDDQEAERIAFAEIDWHDYAIVQTIEFTAADANAELPPPMSVQEVESMTLAQKRMAAMIMETTAEDVEAHRARQAAAEAEAAAAVGQAGAGAAGDEDAMQMDESDDEDEEIRVRKKREEEERRREEERARAIQASSLEAGAPMKIRTDYVPKVGAKGKQQTTTTCSICGQQIPVDELQEHMRIELLDPRWKEQRNALEARKAQASELQKGANVAASIKNLARTRPDIFGAEEDEERRKREEEEERQRRRAREKVVWDGHTASKASTQDKFSTNVNFEEQIAAIYRAKGLGPQEAGAIGPGIGPAAAPPPPMAGLPPAPVPMPAPPQQAPGGGPAPAAYTAATISSGPQPASLTPAPAAPVMLPPLHYQGLGAQQPFGFSPPPPPMGMAMSPQAGMVRTADQMEGGAPDDVPPAKRQRVAKLPGGALYPEADWLAMHPYPISLQVQLPNDPSKPEWKLDGTVITIPELPLSLLVSTLRDRILQHTGSSVGASKIRLSHAGKMLTNQNTLASYNLEDEDLVILSVRDVKKK
ncbi:hypothetical protein GLOTRDRAFT_114877 [Gloeophyllum trabeum ATCC 11539]|uniref:Surp module n=1 Tax=Gloeophyllum trabeum (strain ATCC 11539 / FP-39264 / Madison 617) TaxID=670483 RepID=S7RYH0_GLOTA|nr:uncharacterized protein GLOTRDRAFT_114877 [Gloeophyllum trabeum ATCC 11539]EPQ58449.1 hypothetical protein GLOTRDRAFT_114877 [Gloeophyllum trabeum ATCC 11539]